MSPAAYYAPRSRTTQRRARPSRTAPAQATQCATLSRLNDMKTRAWLVKRPLDAPPPHLPRAQTSLILRSPFPCEASFPHTSRWTTLVLWNASRRVDACRSDSPFRTPRFNGSKRTYGSLGYGPRGERELIGRRERSWWVRCQLRPSRSYRRCWCHHGSHAHTARSSPSGPRCGFPSCSAP
ncbi:hypothetical protein OH77DRAFT_1063496 [Trametes cingulata]|nr:hypothetical protein OH77DRAFT_1063496 [Trametes cingulata]